VKDKTRKKKKIEEKKRIIKILKICVTLAESALFSSVFLLRNFSGIHYQPKSD